MARAGSKSPEVTHLQLQRSNLCDAVDDHVCVGGFFLGGGGVILVLFEGVSGLHINWRKNFLSPINKVTNMDGFAAILGGEVGSSPTTYLGCLSW